MKKVINIICSYASIYGGNFIPSIVSLSKDLRKNGDDVLFIFPNIAKNRNWARYIIDQGFKIYFIDFGNKFSKNLKKINKTNNVNLLYSHFLSGLRLKLSYPFSKKMKLLIHVHSDFSGGASNGIISKMKRFFEYKLLRRDATYICVGKGVAKKLNYKNSIYLPNALCLERVPCENVNIQNFKNKYGIKTSDTVFLHFGWSPFVKGTDIAIKAFLDSYPKNKNTKLIIVYGRDNGYAGCLSYLKKCNINTKKLDDNIIFVPPSEDIFSLYDVADVFISSSRSEGFSYSILESLFFNLKVLSSDIPGVQWSKKYNVNFFKNSIDLTKEIIDLVSFKKEKMKNYEILNDFNIKNWCSAIILCINKITL